ncbi:MAG: hypothetical protein PF489_16505 [Salinivirgaceae bacterium]|jgi:TolB-like protein|nr:hypothetical protein [Salinivirgaceae bacterium]
MKNTLVTFAVIVFMTINFTGFTQNKVAVLSPEDKSNSGFANVMREMLITGISKSDYYSPITKALVDKVLKENNNKIVEVGDEEMVSKLGKQVGADFICVSMVQKVDSNFFITTKLVNAETSSVVFQEYLRTEKGEEDLYDKVDELAKMLSNFNNNSSSYQNESNDNLIAVEIDFLKYMVMPKDFDNQMNYVIARDACSDLIAHGYDDWFLPTRDQLNGLYLNKEKLGGFGSDPYWSVSALDKEANAQNFDKGVQQDLPKSTVLNVRCIRMIYD